MAELTERLEVRVEPRTIHRLRQEAKRRSVSVAEIVREAIQLSLEKNREARLRAAKALFEVEAPVSDWEQMKEEIEAAHQSGEIG